MGGFLGGLLVATRINGVEGLSFLGISIPAVTYTSTIFPILLGVAFMYYVDKVLKKIIPDVLILFAKPLLTMIIVVPVELIILGPFGTVVSNLIGNFCIWLTNTLGFLAHPILAMASPYLIMFGFDKALTPIAVNLLATKGYNSLTCIMGFCSNLAVGGATLAMATLSKGNAERKGMLSSFGVTALCGVTEPAFYGALISTPKALIGQAIGAGLAGLVGGLFKMRAFASGGCPGLLTLLLFVDQTGSLYYVYRAIILAIIAISASFIATRIILTRDLKKKANRGN